MSSPKRLKVLWLCSWYPSEVDPFSGDFIQRHAEAVSYLHDLHIIHVVKSDRFKRSIRKKQLKSQYQLVEEVIYYRAPCRLFEKALSQLMLAYYYLRAIHRFRTIHGKPDLLHYHVGAQLGIPSFFISLFFPGPYILSEHWGGFMQDIGGGLRQLGRIRLYRMDKLIANARSVHVVSDALKNAMQKRYPIAAYRIIPNVVDTDLFHVGREKPGIFTFIHISDGGVLKGVNDLVQAAKLLRARGYAFNLLLIGNKNPELPVCISREKLGAVISCFGELPHDEVAARLRLAHAMVHPSYLETFGCVVIESFAAGVPVIAYEIPVLQELIVPGFNGLFAKEMTPESLADAMEAMINTNSSFSQFEISAEAKRKFSMQVVAAQFDAWYKDCLK